MLVMQEVSKRISRETTTQSSLNKFLNKSLYSSAHKNYHIKYTTTNRTSDKYRYDETICYNSGQGPEQKYGFKPDKTPLSSHKFPGLLNLKQNVNLITNQ